MPDFLERLGLFINPALAIDCCITFGKGNPPCPEACPPGLFGCCANQPPPCAVC